MSRLEGRETDSAAAPAAPIAWPLKAFACCVVVLIVAAVLQGTRVAAFGSEVLLVASQSSCTPLTDGRVTFQLAFENVGDRRGTIVALPLVHTVGPRLHAASLVAVSADLDAGETLQRTAATLVGARPTDVSGCEVFVDGKRANVQLRRP